MILHVPENVTWLSDDYYNTPIMADFVIPCLTKKTSISNK